MKVTLSKNKTFFSISPTPDKVELYGLKIILKSVNDLIPKSVRTDLIARKKRYYLYQWTDEMKESISGAEILKKGIWYKTELIKL
jgi:hypothetical protein